MGSTGVNDTGVGTDDARGFRGGVLNKHTLEGSSKCTGVGNDDDARGFNFFE